jgi:hypothetical protein
MASLFPPRLQVTAEAANDNYGKDFHTVIDRDELL